MNVNKPNDMFYIIYFFFPMFFFPLSAFVMLLVVMVVVANRIERSGGLLVAISILFDAVLEW